MANSGSTGASGKAAAAREKSAQAAAVTPHPQARDIDPAGGRPASKTPVAKAATGSAKRSPTRKVPASKPAGTAVPAQQAAQTGPRPEPTQPAATKTSARKANAVTKTTAHPPASTGTDWSASELAEVRTELEHQLAELRAEYDDAIAELNDVQQFARDGAGDDQADTGTKTLEREQELSIVHNRLDLLTQVERAIERISSGTYGVCEGCGKPIAKARLQAFPSATLCVECKQREERR